MSNHPIEIFGVTPLSHFPKCPPHHPCTQFCEIDKLCIPLPKINIECIQQVCLKVCISSFKTILTPAGKKLVVHGKKQVKVFFISDDPRHCIHVADFDIPFCTFILLKDIPDEVVEICSVVEDISVRCLDYRCLTVTSIIFVCPVFEKDHQLCPCSPEHTTNCEVHGNHCQEENHSHDKQQCTCHTPHDYHSQYDDHCQSPHPQSICKNCKSALKY